MVRFRTLSTSVVASISVLALAACAGSEESFDASCEQTIRFGFSHSYGDSAYVSSLYTALEKAVEADPCAELLLDNTQGGDLENQRATIESWIAQDLDAIVVVPAEVSALEGLRTEAQAKDIKWITYAAPQEGADGSIGFDNADSGRIAGQAVVDWMAETYPDGGATVAVTMISDPVWLPRASEAVEVLEAAGIEVVSYQECNAQDCGLQIVEDTLREHPDLRAIIGLNDDAALGGVRGFQNAGIPDEEVFAIGQDGGKEALEALLTGGPFRATVAIEVETLAEGLFQTAKNAAWGEGETDNITPVELVYQDQTDRIDELLAQQQG